MPIYEYACNRCEHVFDVLQKISDHPLKYCPECGAPELRKLVSAPSFRLKGAGWYETDFKTGNKRNLMETGDKKDGKGDKAEKADKTEKADKPAKTSAAAGDGKASDSGS